MLKIYYSPNINDITQFKAKDIWWMPEKLNPIPSMDQLYLDGQTIVTCHPNMLDSLQIAITQQLVSAEKVLFFKMDSQPPAVYTFTPDGNIKSFWPIKM